MAKKKIDYAAMFTLRSDGRYVATYTDFTGRHHIYDRDPEKLYRKLQEKTAPVEERTPTFREIAEGWERQHREEITQRTWQNYEPHYRDIISRHGGKPIEAVTAQAVSNHLAAAKAKGYSATVVNSIRSVYRMIFDYAIVNDYAQYNPVTSVRLPKGLHRGKRTAPTDVQIKKILTSTDAPFGLFPFFLLCTGMRKSEALALTWDDIDLEACEISVTKSLDYTVGSDPKIKPPKTEAGNRTVPIIDPLREKLLTAMEESTSPYLFPAQPSTRGGNGGGLMTLRGYEGAWLRWCETTGLIDNSGKPTLTAHNLRHGTATLMFELGVDELTAQKILGHSRVEITREIYTDLRAKQKMRSVDKFNAGLSKMLSEL
jgi:integrase